MESTSDKSAAATPLRHGDLLFLALSGFVTSFGAHIVAARLSCPRSRLLASCPQYR
jgi:hypothetical protein